MDEKEARLSRQPRIDVSRRNFVAKVAAGAAGLALASRPALAQNQGQNAGRQNNAAPQANPPTPAPAPRLGTGLQMNFACTLYDNMLPLYRRLVEPQGINLDFVMFDDPRDVSERQAAMAEFDSSEMFVSDYILSRGYNANFLVGSGPFIAIPAFPTHMFHHRSIVINKKSGIQAPKDLEGKRVGVPDYWSIGAISIRSLLRHEYAVNVSKIHWIQAGAGTRNKPNLLPGAKAPTLDLNTGGKSLDDLLVAGGLDAVIDSDPPAGKSADVQRLFPNFKAVEMEYYQRTRILPVISVVVIRRAYFDRYSFIARSLYTALARSKDFMVAQMHSDTKPNLMPPFLASHCDEIRATFPGGDPCPYGLDANRPALTELGFGMIEDGLIPPTPIDTLFVPVAGSPEPEPAGPGAAGPAGPAEG